MTDQTSISIYFSKVDGGKLLTREEELNLAEQMFFARAVDKNGEFDKNNLWKKDVDTKTLQKAKRARKKLIESNLRLVASVAKNFQNQGCELEDLIQEGNIGLMDGIDRFDHTRGLKISTYCCVPLSTQILTKRGWKHYDELIDGDETLGYKDGQTVWTEIEGIVTYGDAPLLKIGDSLWEAVCTPNHKWLISQNGKVELKPIEEWPNQKDYEFPKKNKKTGKYARPKTHLITSAPFVGGKSSITPDEAALLAWVLSDGSMFGDYKNKNPDGACIVQKKCITEIRSLLKRLGIPKNGHQHNKDGCLKFTVNAKFFRNLWKKAKLDKISYSDFVLNLSQESRKAWLNAWILAEGTRGRKTIAQNEGEKLEAIILTKFLEGLPDIQVKVVDKKKGKCFRVSHHEKWRTPRRCTVSEYGRGKVWCPKTKLGSWTARSENNSIFLTGNTWWIRQRIDRLISNHSRTVRIPVHVQTNMSKLKGVMEKFKEEFGCNPSVPEVAVALDVSEEMARAALESMNSGDNVSLDATPAAAGLNSKTDEPLHSYIRDEESSSPYDIIVHQDLIEKIRNVIDTLPDRDQKIIRLRFGIIEDENDTDKWPISEEELKELHRRKENE